MFRASSSTRRTVRPTRSSSERLSRSSIRCFSGGNCAVTRCMNSAVSSSSRSGDSTPFTTMLLAILCSCASSSADSSRPVKTTTGTVCRSPSLPICSSTSNPDMSGRRRSSTTQSKDALSMAESASSPVVALTISISSCASSSVMLSCSAGSSSTMRRLRRRGAAYSLTRSRSRPSSVGVVGLVTKENAPRDKPVLPVFVERHDVDRDVTRQRILLELAEHGPAEHVGEEDVERNGRRLILLARDRAHRRRAWSTITLKPRSRAISAVIRA